MAIVKMERKFSKHLGKEVLLIHEKFDRPYIDCTCCGKDLKNFYTIQDLETDVEMYHVGSECLKSVM